MYEDHITLGDIYGKYINVYYQIYVEWAQRNGYQKIPSMLTFTEDMCALYNVEVAYADDSKRRANDKVFARRIQPTEAEMEETPF